MTGTTVVPPEVGAYLASVRDALADLPPAERDDLLAEVEVSLAEAAAESGSPIASRLGPPEDFAAELRAAAGLQAGAPARSRIFSLAADLGAWASRSHWIVGLRRALAELAPIWWVVRGYLAVGLVGVVSDAEWSTLQRGVPRLGSGELGLLAILAAVAISIAIGLHSRRHGRPHARLAAAANAVLLLAAVPVVSEVADTNAHDALVAAAYAPPEPQPELAYRGISVTNIYPYDADGRLLFDVLLYDNLGRPIEIGAGAGDPNRRLLRTSLGKPMFNSFPIRYYEPGTRRVDRPALAPGVEVPELVVPSLRPRR